MSTAAVGMRVFFFELPVEMRKFPAVQAFVQ
jgi:hypothetical protein